MSSNPGLSWKCAKSDVANADPATQVATVAPCGTLLEQPAICAMEVDCAEPHNSSETKSMDENAVLPPSTQQCEEELQGDQLIATLTALYTALIKNARFTSLGGTSFHCAKAPQMGIDAYLARLHTHFQCSDACFILSLVYIDRVVKCHPTFLVNELSIHRLLATTLTLGAKFHDDIYYSNAYYGKVVGLKLKEMNSLEAELLKMIDWRLDVSPEEYSRYQGRLLRAHRASAGA